MIYGDQWNCVCGWANLFLRKRCRNCGRDKLANAQIIPAGQVIAIVSSLTQPPEPK